MSEYVIDEAKVPVRETQHDFVYDKPRDFQADFLDWLYDSESEPVVVLNAPTGAGKTATFNQLITESDGVVMLIYPTNALIKNQKYELEQSLDVNITHITSETLQKHGINRARELKSYITDISTEVVITNPDILQAVIQGAYVDPYGSLVEIYEHCNIVFDEFHYYDDLSASGILLQTYISVKRSQQNNTDIGGVIFSSATPTNYYKMLEELQIQYKLIQSQYTEQGDIFRHKTNVKTNPEYTYENIKQITKNIKKYVKNNNPTQLEIAVICNSVKTSNQLYNQIQKHQSLQNITIKDNGYDTNSKEKQNFDNKNILITTSKAEVGLNYDIKQLYMDKPYNFESFIQRFGRAGRKSPATVHVYGMAKTTWNEKQKYKQFVENIKKSLPRKQSNKTKILKLMGLRATYALNVRSQPKQQLKQNLKNIPYYDYWYPLIKQHNNKQNKRYTPKEEKFVNAVTEQILSNLKTLRGNSIKAKLIYDKGSKKTKTEYNLLSVINQYNIEKIENGYIHVDDYKSKEHMIILKHNHNKYRYKHYGDLYVIKENIKQTITDSSLNTERLQQAINLLEPKQVMPIEKLILNTDFTVEYYELEKP